MFTRRGVAVRLRLHAAHRRAGGRRRSSRVEPDAVVRRCPTARPRRAGCARKSGAGMDRRYPDGYDERRRAAGRVRDRHHRARWASAPTSWSSPTSSCGPSGTGSASARAAARPQAAWSPTRWASPTWTRSQHGLIFERFLNPERVSMPDIDIDFDERRRGDVIRYVTEKWGDDRVAQIITYGTIKAKAAVKDAARVLGFPYALGDRITKAFPPAVMGKDIPLAGIFDDDAPPVRRGGRDPRPVRGRGRGPPGHRHRARAGGADPAGRGARGRRDHEQRADHRPRAGLEAARPTARSSPSSTTRPASRSACSRWTSSGCAT